MPARLVLAAPAAILAASCQADASPDGARRASCEAARNLRA